jgi:hypothetical protein
MRMEVYPACAQGGVIISKDVGLEVVGDDGYQYGRLSKTWTAMLP